MCAGTHRQFVDAQSRHGRSVAPELRHEGELVEVPDDARSIPGAADDNTIRRGRRQTRYSIRVAQQRLGNVEKQTLHLLGLQR